MRSAKLFPAQITLEHRVLKILVNNSVPVLSTGTGTTCTVGNYKFFCYLSVYRYRYRTTISKTQVNCRYGVGTGMLWILRGMCEIQQDGSLFPDQDYIYNI
jgi:hypothetical protein